ncbi:MAG: hypothetical protein K8S99_14400 [Planctomycetes bacterium]|nr:hypothetical protein [Planctomycetota bacterium]
MMTPGSRTVGLLCMWATALGLTAISTAAEHEIHMGAAVAKLAGVEAVTEKNGDGIDEQFWRVGENFEVYLSPAMPEGTVKREEGRLVIGLGLKADPIIDNIARIVYETRTAKMPYNVNLTLAIFTHPGSDPQLGADDGKWFQRQLQSEPLYITHLESRFTPNFWSTFSTDDPESPLGFYDPHHGPAGFGKPPTLESIQQATSYSQVWQEWWKECGSKTPEDSYHYGPMKVRYVALTTASGGNWAKFRGDLRRLTLSIRGDDTISVIFDAGKSPTIDDETPLLAAVSPANPTSTTGPAKTAPPAAATPQNPFQKAIAAVMPPAKPAAPTPQGLASEDLPILAFAGIGVVFVLIAGLIQWSRSRQPAKNGKRAPAR